MSYNVVLEHTSKAGGYAGIRVIRCYQDKLDFQKKKELFEGYYNVVAEGVSYFMAQDLFAQTPEICRITASISRIFEYTVNNGCLDRDCVIRELDTAKRRIEDDRHYRSIHHLVLDNGVFCFVQSDKSEDARKDLIFNYIRDKFYTNNGAVEDLSNTIDILKVYILAFTV